jgi:hypothetical protein
MSLPARTLLSLAITRRFLVLSAALGTAAVDVSALRAQPVNDDFANSTVIPSELTCGSFVADASMATAEPGEPQHNPNELTKSLWWMWQPRYPGETVFGLTKGRATVAVYHGETLGSLQRIARFSDNVYQTQWDCSNPRDFFRANVFAANPGTTYWIAVNGTANWSLAQRTFELVSSAAGQRLTLGSSGAVRLETINSEFDHPIERAELILGRTENPGDRPIYLVRTLASSSSAPHRFSWRPRASGFWWLAARGTNSAGEVRQTAPVLHHVSPANDDFARATVIPPATRFASFKLNFAAASLEPGEPPDVYGWRPSLWWKWTPSWSGAVQLTARDSRQQGMPLEVFTGRRLTNLVRVTRASQFTVTAGVTYRIRVLSSGSTGTQWFEIRPYTPRPTPPPPALPIYARNTFQPHPSLLPYGALNRFQRLLGSRNTSSSARRTPNHSGYYGSSSVTIIGGLPIVTVEESAP